LTRKAKALQRCFDFGQRDVIRPDPVSQSCGQLQRGNVDAAKFGRHTHGGSPAVCVHVSSSFGGSLKEHKHQQIQ
jgi:hypothetical protein